MFQVFKKSAPAAPSFPEAVPASPQHDMRAAVLSISKQAAITQIALQTYRRDMGGGQFVLLKEARAPISVNGRHWGGLRLAFTF